MLKLRKPRHEKHSDPELDISSLIDVSFLLLIFFLVTSTLLKRESDLAMKLPTPGEGVDPTEALQIAIAGDGRITIGGQEMAGPSDQGVASQITEVRNQLTEHRKRAELFGDQPFVSLRASDEANTQRFVDVLNALAYAGIDRIALQDDLAAN
ncbi:MAG: biopolymer transport protein ExbD [Verrucomicrobiales bacterium]|jgi:biopolymer transport protein ExbD